MSYILYKLIWDAKVEVYTFGSITSMVLLYKYINVYI